jgi:predicted RNA binding protein YcfA (HicA-like mRNA interferase family)
MPELRNIKAKDAVKAFMRAGLEKRPGGKGDHINLKAKNGMLITIPNRGTVSIGLLKAAIKKAELTEEEFLNLL